MQPFISNGVTMPTVGTTVNTNQPTSEDIPKGSNHSNLPPPTQTASGQFSFLNARTITQTNMPYQPRHFDDFSSQKKADEDPMVDLHVLADAALERAKGASDTNEAAASKTDALSEASVIVRRSKRLQLNKQESNPNIAKNPQKPKKPAIYVCDFIINTDTKQICDKQLSRKDYLRLHTGETPFSSHLCDKAYTNVSNLIKRKRIHTKKEEISATLPPSSDTSASTTAILNKTPEIRRQQKIFQLDNQVSNPNEHKIQEPDIHLCNFIINTLTNQICGQTFSIIGNLTKHIETHTKSKMFTCDVCNKPCISPSALKTHKLSHSNDRPFYCNHCDARFKTQYHLERHAETHTRKHFFYCTFCDKKFSRKDTLAEHARSTHSISKADSLVCDICFKAYTYKSSCIRHQRTHTATRPATHVEEHSHTDPLLIRHKII